eukprot:gnl/Trimastix_PCT/3426.p1 GENE.gnl/Trimastix_PCT/3426~~gnl/Trimastix_PCT/3426.p1  ORF type:complete len:414 (-),score=70.52 gnl/Trimastix_PCT/3426:608-1762(-)
MERQLRVYIGTWNVNAKLPDRPLSEWISLKNCGVVALSMQEVVPLNTSNMLSLDLVRLKSWERKIEATLEEEGQYIKVISRQLFGLALLLYVRDDLLKSVSNVQVEATCCGPMGMANKGAIAVSFELFDHTLCFLGTHMTAGRGKNLRRAADYHSIMRHLRFKAPARCIMDHDAVFWFGDLNYRIARLSYHEVKSLIARRKFAELLENDQLALQRAAGDAFVPFLEVPPCFAPTYRYDPGTDNYDSREKPRVPSWCDRILWHAFVPLRPLSYQRHDPFQCSDHRPVSGHYQITLPAVRAPRPAPASPSACAREELPPGRAVPAPPLPRAPSPPRSLAPQPPPPMLAHDPFTLGATAAMQADGVGVGVGVCVGVKRETRSAPKEV